MGWENWGNMGGVLGLPMLRGCCSVSVIMAAFGCLILSSTEFSRVSSFFELIMQNSLLHEIMQYYTHYNLLYPILSVQSLVNIWDDPTDMVEQVNSYSDVLADSGMASLSFNEGQFLYFALQGQVPLQFLQVVPDAVE